MVFGVWVNHTLFNRTVEEPTVIYCCTVVQETVSRSTVLLLLSTVVVSATVQCTEWTVHGSRFDSNSRVTSGVRCTVGRYTVSNSPVTDSSEVSSCERILRCYVGVGTVRMCIPYSTQLAVCV
jgi:hypothetical protein